MCVWWFGAVLLLLLLAKAFFSVFTYEDSFQFCCRRHVTVVYIAATHGILCAHSFRKGGSNLEYKLKKLFVYKSNALRDYQINESICFYFLLYLVCILEKSLKKAHFSSVSSVPPIVSPLLLSSRAHLDFQCYE